ncbi:hypothetical protein [Phaeodactylibacter luteus]|uniref:Uncharacterized protein n=1 Tax=Phaeodactylibacter luteus TaxID=1564516 RepID=A0A5C6RL05_9BACT|nr:hypothetical protein [Phaeodactylibacter luteus]TXB62917.1 hypothetical protein FRY97_11270 [Phaeodactylibacter luteus]
MKKSTLISALLLTGLLAYTCSNQNNSKASENRAPEEAGRAPGLEELVDSMVVTAPLPAWNLAALDQLSDLRVAWREAEGRLAAADSLWLSDMAIAADRDFSLAHLRAYREQVLGEALAVNESHTLFLETLTTLMEDAQTPQELQALCQVLNAWLLEQGVQALPQDTLLQ